MKLARRFIRDERGANAVEFALLALPLFMLLVGTVEYGRMMWTRQALQSVAVSTARCMGIRQSDCATTGTYSSVMTTTFAIEDGASLGLALTQSDVNLNLNATCNGVTGMSRATISTTFETAAPDLLTDLVGGKELSHEACFPNQS